MTYLNHVLSTKQTPQSAPIPGSEQAPNSAGGYAWAADDWTRFDRFLILGTEGGSYYATEASLTLENAEVVRRCVEADGERAVRRIAEISFAGRAPKNDPAIFALAVAASSATDRTRAAALLALPRVCRTGTHLHHFAGYVDGMRGWGRGLRAAVGRWYSEREPRDLAYQAVKYQQRDGWSHRDLLRLSHPIAEPDSARNAIYHWITKGWEEPEPEPPADEGLQLVWAFEQVKRAGTKEEVAHLIRTYGLPREAIPTRWLLEPMVWEALLTGLPLTALIRNLATLTRIGLLTQESDVTRRVVEQLTDPERLSRARVHPIQVLAALYTYAQGHGERGTNTWAPLARIVDALDAAFYASFGSVRPTGKRWMLALDISGSMGQGQIAGVPGLTPWVASIAMALVTAAVEPEHEIVAFTSGADGHGGKWGGGEPGLTPVPISPRQRMDDVARHLAGLTMGGTDCALPLLHALRNQVPVDCFVVYTDSETWHGEIHPAQALRQYRERMGIPARLVVCGMVSNGFTIADPDDAGMLDVVGFDTATPNLISDFVAHWMGASEAPSGG
ncbi:MAG: hypothetical protein K0Q72_1374 [Armatimonadetes bacterium]|jgi:60 kDa SS-A/Ro ribonucleoprotein|nr:hypothetical protein [Armatimonadota bacterium]